MNASWAESFVSFIEPVIFAICIVIVVIGRFISLFGVFEIITIVAIVTFHLGFVRRKKKVM